MTRVKICCISSIEEAWLAIKYGASAIGLVSEMPSGPGVIPEELIEKIAGQIPPGLSTFLLTSKQGVAGIVEQQRRCKTNTIQLCDRIVNGTHAELKQSLPGIKIVQVIHVRGEDSIQESIKISKSVDAILLDSGNQNLSMKELGGTGKTHNWIISRKIVEAVDVPVFLAGGLNSENVAVAIQQVKPFGVDVCSGVRSNGKLDINKLKLFFQSVNAAENIN